MKNKLTKIKNNKVITYSNACTVYSYKGWAKWCSNNVINKKYIIPLERRIIDGKVFQCK